MATIPEEPARPRPRKVDSDTQTNVSAIAVANLSSASMPHLRLATSMTPKKSTKRSSKSPVTSPQSPKEPLPAPTAAEKECPLPTIDESPRTTSENDSSSKSNTSHSSTDSVIFRPSSCDELESGKEEDQAPPSQSPPTDHITSLRKRQQERQGAGQGSQGAGSGSGSDKGTAEKSDHSSGSLDSPLSPHCDSIKPMAPLQTAPYSYLRSASSPAPPVITRPRPGDGYLSDGDLLRGEGALDGRSGYLSEGGADMYARRLQDRLREGMQAVKDCMQKSAAIVDTESYDDSSSISSGDISDNINDVSTDDITTGSSLSATSSEPSYKYQPPPVSGHQAYPIAYASSLPSRSANTFVNKGNFEAGGISWKKYVGDGSRTGVAGAHVGSLRGLKQVSSGSRLTGVAVEESNFESSDAENRLRGVRRPSTPSSQGSVGERLSNYRSMVYARTPSGQIVFVKDPSTDMGPEAYSASTLERRKDYASNSLGRRDLKERLFGSRGSINKMSTSADTGMVIGNPGGDPQPSPQRGVHMFMTSSADYTPQRPHSAMSNPAWAPGWGGAPGYGGVDNISSSMQAQIHQAKVLAQASRNIIAQSQAGHTSLHRNESLRSARSEAGAHLPATLPRTGSHAGLTDVRTDGRTGTGAGLNYHVLSSDKDDVHGSALSLVSSNSSVYSTSEEKHNAEIRKLRRELDQAQDKVHNLTTQLSTNAHVVAAFEQSLSNMTSRLQHLTSTSEQKDSELLELRQTIDSLRAQTGLYETPGRSRRHSTNASSGNPQGYEGSIRRQASAESMSSLNSLGSACSGVSQQSDAKKRNKKAGWLRSSFSRAFSKKKPVSIKTGSSSDVECELAGHHMMAGHHGTASMPATPIKSPSTGSGSERVDDIVVELQHQLHEKELKLTDVQLEALSSAAQLEQMKDTLRRMKSEMSSLKADNDRLKKFVKHQNSTESVESTAAPAAKVPPSPCEGQRVTVSVLLAPSSEIAKRGEGCVSQIMIGEAFVNNKTRWDNLDQAVKKIFKEYCLRIDPVTNLGINTDSLLHYSIGEKITRSKDQQVPDLLPCGYLVGDCTDITITLRSTSQNAVDSLAFDLLVPKTIVQRYVSLLVEHRRIILCGPSGTGKTHLAQKLAEFLIIRSGKEVNAGSIATFNVEHKSSKDLRQYLCNVADQCEHGLLQDLPAVIILDNLHHVSSLPDVFNGFLNVKYHQCPYIIGTMNQATCSTTNLQLHHNFRWVLCANHMEPVKGFLARYLRRKLIDEEVRRGASDDRLQTIVEWLPQVWQHLNRFLELHSSSDMTIGPRLFLSCPMDVQQASNWFTDLWNYSITPYMMEAVREGIQSFGQRSPWEDPLVWILETLPWISSPDCPELHRLRPEDVGYDMSSSQTMKPQQPPVNKDPLFSVLLKLQDKNGSVTEGDITTDSV